MVDRRAPQLPWRLFREIRSSKSTASPHCPKAHCQKNRSGRNMNITSSRRGFLGLLGAITGALAAAPKLFAAKSPAADSAQSVNGFGSSGNPYQELGVTTVINA